MRDVFCQALVAEAGNPAFVFLTGDLGFKALEPLREALGERFINAGVSEQNMISMAAGLAKMGFRPWVYSIAPFLYARPFEQIRNDVCLHHLPVVMVGNGGGYGYGVMGSSHHALEDYGALLTLSNLRAFVPAFDSDVAPVVGGLMTSSYPAYLRLGRSEEPSHMPLPPYAPWRRLMKGSAATLVATGPLAGGLLEPLSRLKAERPDVWLVSELPVTDLPDEFVKSVSETGHLFAIEEHTVQGGLGQMLVHRLACAGRMPPRFTHRYATGYVSGRYGSQNFHRRESGLDAASIVKALTAG